MMPNISDYLDWRGDIPFSTDPFNEVDNLILAELSYTDFEGIVSDNPEEIFTIQRLKKLYFAKHSKEELEARISFIKYAPFLLEKLAESKRFENLRITAYVNDISVDQDVQMSAITFFPGDGTTYVAYRGTDTTLVGWKEDFKFSYQTETIGQKKAVEYLNRIGNGWPDMPLYAKTALKKLRVGGHSKGGNFAVYASAFANQEVKDKIIQIYSNDGPGFVKEITETTDYQSILPLVKSTIPEGSVVGLLLTNDLEHKYIESSEKNAIAQHDPFSWQVLGNHFVKAGQQSESSIFFDATMQKWLGGLSNEEKRDFTNAIFDVLAATGMTTYSEIFENKNKAMSGILSAIAKVPKDKQQEFSQILRKLFVAGAQEIGKNIPKPISKNMPSGSEIIAEGSEILASGTEKIKTRTEKLVNEANKRKAKRTSARKKK